MKKGKEINVQLNDEFKTFYGTVNNKELKTIYVGITTWIEPVDDLDDYSRQLSKLRKTIQQCVYQNINPDLFSLTKYIIDVDVKGIRMDFNKQSYLNVNITLFVNNITTIVSDTVRNDITRLMSIIISHIKSVSDFEYKQHKLKYHTVN